MPCTLPKALLCALLLLVIAPPPVQSSAPRDVCPVNATRFGALTCPDNWSCCKMPTTLVCADESPPCTSCADCCHSYLNSTQCAACHKEKCGGASVIGDAGCHANVSKTWTPYTEYCCGRGLPRAASTTLSNCLLIGDSVMHGAAQLVIDALASECQVQIFVGNDAAGEAACWGAASAEAATGAPVGFDVIHFNEGLHSLYPRVNTTDASGALWAQILANWTDVLKLGSPPPSLIYATMTPMMEQRACNPPGVPAHNVEALNALAVETVTAKGVPVHDLYGLIFGACGGKDYVACPLCDNETQYACEAYQREGGICMFHYVTQGWELLANSTVTAIREALKARREGRALLSLPTL